WISHAEAARVLALARDPAQSDLRSFDAPHSRRNARSELCSSLAVRRGHGAREHKRRERAQHGMPADQPGDRIRSVGRADRHLARPTSHGYGWIGQRKSASAFRAIVISPAAAAARTAPAEVSGRWDTFQVTANTFHAPP